MLTICVPRCVSPQVGKTCKFLQGPGTQQAALKALHTAVREQRKVTISLINYRQDGQPFRNVVECSPVRGGSHFYATLTGTPITDGSVAPIMRPSSEVIPESGRPVLEPVCYAGRHVNKRPKRTLDKMQLLHALANNDDPIVICSKEYPHVITHPNQAWLDMCGYSLEEVEGMTNSILTGPETDAAAIARIVKNAKQEKPSCETIVNYKKGGVKFLNQVQIKPLYDENDELAAFMSMLTEVDESEQA
jgi:PAS domain S-box-containing protein